ncbi:S-adenosyl-L-methionine-dependent methyltransferase [Biscogniauxia mediterranea]|nr:S-adenosyl-L-methionine-dependent methyltransferase [Biscogniauxia mediterranea]
MASTPADLPTDLPARLIGHFVDKGREHQNQNWSDIWNWDESKLWDRGQPSRPLIDFLGSNPWVLQQANHGKTRPRALVAKGCGKGYDVVMLELHGYDVYAVDVSPKAVQVAREYAATELSEPGSINYSLEDDWRQTTTGTVKIINGDFFTHGWEEQCALDGNIRFDFIYDYTFLCALLPEMRKDWAQRMSELLAPDGVLVCLKFPLWKALSDPGPPWPLKGVDWNLLVQGGDGQISEPPEETESPEGKCKRLLCIKPRKSYPIGRGTDMLSVWALKEA